MKEQLYEEFKLDDDTLPKGKKIEDINLKEHAKVLVELRKKYAEFQDDHDIDPSMFYAFTKDFMRVDIGLMI